MCELSTDEREDLICDLARTMDLEAWSRADGSPFLPQGPEWSDRRSTSRECATYAVDGGYRPVLAARPVVDVEGLTEIVRVEMSRGAYQMLPHELPYESSARRVAAAVVAYLAGDGRG